MDIALPSCFKQVCKGHIMVSVIGLVPTTIMSSAMTITCSIWPKCWSSFLWKTSPATVIPNGITVYLYLPSSVLRWSNRRKLHPAFDAIPLLTVTLLSSHKLLLAGVLYLQVSWSGRAHIQWPWSDWLDPSICTLEVPQLVLALY